MGDILLLGQNQCHVTGVKSLILGLPIIWHQKKFPAGWKKILFWQNIHLYFHIVKVGNLFCLAMYIIQ